MTLPSNPYHCINIYHPEEEPYFTKKIQRKKRAKIILAYIKNKRYNKYFLRIFSKPYLQIFLKTIPILLICQINKLILQKKQIIENIEFFNKSKRNKTVIYKKKF